MNTDTSTHTSTRTSTITKTVVSRHTTSEGVVVWTRCTCGRLQMVLVPYGADGKELTAGGHDTRCPHCGR